MPTLRSACVRSSLLATAALLAACAAPRSPAPIADAPTRQDPIPDIDRVHPRTMVTIGVGIGDQTNEINSGDLLQGVATSSTSATHVRLRGEHYFESGFGAFAEFYVGTADDILEDLGIPDSKQDTTGFFLAAAYRATMDDKFRLPVRFGPFMHTTETEFQSTDGPLERSTFGVRLSAEPEYIVMQRNHGGRISELSVFAEVRAGAGPVTVEDDVDSEDSYAFLLDYEFGVRYRFDFGLMASLSYFASKYHVGTTESYDNAVFFGVDDDFNGVMITGGWRF